MGSLSHEVLQLLALRESAAVPLWAAVRLAALCGAAQSRVLAVFPVGAARRSGASAQYAISVVGGEKMEAPAPIGDDQPLLAAISSRRPVQGSDAGERWLIPLCAAEEARYVIEVSGIDDKAPGGALAAELMPVLNAYFDLLADAEADPLTRLANRRLFYSQVGAGLAAWTSGASECKFLAMADIDHFKQVNDTYGHLYGDEILIHFARLMRETFRANDLLYRFGGEEFVIVFGVEHAEHGRVALERFRRAVESYDFPRVGRITASIGFTAMRSALVPATTLIDQADQAVYYAKRNGRNRVCEYEALVAEGLLEAHPAADSGEATLF